MAQWLRALVALTNDQSSVTSAHMVVHTFNNFSARESDAILYLFRHEASKWYTHIDAGKIIT